MNVRREVPNVDECGTGVGTAPATGEWDPAENGEELVAAVEGAVEAFVGPFPYAVHGTHTFWLA